MKLGMEISELPPGGRGVEMACWSQDTLDRCLPGGPEARGIFPSWAGGLQKGLNLNLGLVRSGVSNFFRKATATHKSVSTRESYLVILGSLQKECEIKSKAEISENAHLIILISNCRAGKEANVSGLGN